MSKAKKRTWFWAECDDCRGWRSAAVQDRITAQKAADSHTDKMSLARRGNSRSHQAKVVNPADG